MLFRRLKTPGLAHHSYFLQCPPHSAAVIDPRRDIDEYLTLARENDLTITHILETHRQEDFEFGSAALAEATGAKIVAGAHELFGRVDVKLEDGDELEIGTTRIVALHTPGHTPESVCYAVYPATSPEQCWGVFTGDALFVGDTGRTDLTDPSKTAENAGRLYDAVHRKLAPLGEQALVLPAHGAGSACGGNISDRDDSTLGIEMRTNAVFVMTRDEFIEHKSSEKLPRPPYFAHMEEVNPMGGRPLPAPSRVRLLPPREFAKAAEGGIVIDTRLPDAFAAAHIPGSYNIWLKGLPTFGGWIAEGEKAVFLVTDEPGDVPTAVLHLARVGIDAVQGALAGGIAAWREEGLPFDTVTTLSAQKAAEMLKRNGVRVLDVRDDSEWNEKHIRGALHRYVGDLKHEPPQVPKDEPLIVHCSVGNRSGLAASILQRHGFTAVHNMLGGMKAWQNLKLPLEQPAAK